MPRSSPSRPRADVADVSGESPSARSLIVFAVAVAGAAGVLGWGLFVARQAVLLIYVSALFAIGLAPVVRALERRAIVPGRKSLPRWAAVTVVYVLLGAAGVALLLLVVPTLLGQAQDLARNAPDLLRRAQEWLIAHGMTGPQLREAMNQAPGATDAVGAVLLTVWTLLGGLVGVVTIVVLSFYLLIEADALFDAFVRLFPRRRRRHVRVIADEITSKVSAWLSGQMLVAGIIGASTAVVLGLMGLPYFYVLALVAAVGELVPFLGPLLAAIPALGVAATLSWKVAAATAVFFVIQQQVENHLIVPRVMSNQVGLSPVAVIVAFLIGAALFGVVGAILAIPTAAIVQVLFHELVPASDE